MLAGVIEERILHGRAYRYGTLIASQVRAVIRQDGPRRQVSVRFLAGISGALRDELERLLDARGIRGPQVAEQVAPIDLELRSPRGDQRLTGCRLGPPVQRYAPLERIEFRVRPE
jgi:hypothetical protein